MATFKQRIDQHDREIAAIRKLIHSGMKMLVQSQAEIRELRASQRETDRQLRAFIRSLPRGGNGHTKRTVQ